MQAQQLLAKLTHLFPNQAHKIGDSPSFFNFPYDFESLSFILSSSLPHLPLDQLHSLCIRQQRKVMDKILELKSIDIYTEIQSVCTTQRGLKNMPIEQVTSRINQLEAKMALEKDMQSEQEQQMEFFSQEGPSKLSDQSEQIQPMEIDEISYESRSQEKGLENIFEEEYNTHLPWNEICIYDLN